MFQLRLSVGALRPACKPDPHQACTTAPHQAGDARPHLYTPEQLEGAETHDPLWNAAQVQLLREGCIHGYLRMLWGKKILEWSPSPRQGLGVTLELNQPLRARRARP